MKHARKSGRALEFDRGMGDRRAVPHVPQEFIVTDHGRRIVFVFNSPSIVGRGEMTRM